MPAPAADAARRRAVSRAATRAPVRVGRSEPSRPPPAPAAVAASVRGVDAVLLVAVALLVLLGSQVVGSAARASGLGDLGGRHLVYAGVGSVLLVVLAALGRERLRSLAVLGYVLALVGLVVVLLAGVEVNGARSWVDLPGRVQLQPSEPAKLALVCLLASVLADREERPVPDGREVLVALGLAALPVALVLLQPDLGTVLVLLSVVLGVLLVAGTRAAVLLGLLAAGAVVAVTAVWLGLVDPYQLDRLRAFADPSADPRGVGYTVRQARIAVGSGGLTGEGLGEGTQTQGGFVPEQHTDFVMAVTAEELGFLGAGAVVALLGVVLWRGLRAARRSVDTFGALVAAGVVAWFAAQVMINVGMSLGITPVTGLPLPFVSYGGSAMVANLGAVGVLLAVGRPR